VLAQREQMRQDSDAAAAKAVQDALDDY
jgi:hypothetical protein